MFSKIVAKTSLSIFIITFTILVVMISIVLVDYDGSYNDFIQSQAITRQNLQYAIIIAALALTLLATLITWLLSLYGSFKIAGPLYRFTQNIRNSHNVDKLHALRADDYLQDLSQKIINSAEKINAHKQQLLISITQYQKLANSANADKNHEQLLALLKQIKEIESRVIVNE